MTSSAVAAPVALAMITPAVSTTRRTTTPRCHGKIPATANMTAAGVVKLPPRTASPLDRSSTIPPARIFISLCSWHHWRGKALKRSRCNLKVFSRISSSEAREETADTSHVGAVPLSKVRDQVPLLYACAPGEDREHHDGGERR